MTGYTTSKFAAALLFAASLAFAQQPAPSRVGVGMIQRKLSLNDALTLALSNNLEIEIQKTDTGIAAAAVRGARGYFDPTFRWLPSLASNNTPVGSILMGAGGKLAEHDLGQNFYFRQRLPWQGASFGVDFENLRSTSSNPFNSLNPLYSSRLLVSFTQPLLRGRAIDSGRAEIVVRRKQQGISEIQYRLKAIDVITRVEQAYWDLVAARQNAQVQADQVDLARQLLEQNRRMIAAGTLAPVELAASQAELERRMDTWYSAVGAITEAENALKTLLAGGRRQTLWSDELLPTDQGTLPPPELEDLPGAVAQAIHDRPELRVIAGQQDINQVQELQAADQTKPQINLTAGYANMGLGGTIVNNANNPFSASQIALYQRLNDLSAIAGLQPMPAAGFSGAPPALLVGGYGTTLSNLFGGRFQSVSAGLSFDLTFRNNAAEAALAQTAITGRRLRLERSQAEQLIEAQVRNALQALQTARQRIAAAEASERAAKEKLESETRLFHSGESTNFLVLTRQNEYADSRHRALVARLDFNKAIARLEQAVGGTLQSHKISLH